MTANTLPDGFGVRLHDDVEIGRFLVAGPRVVRISSKARRLLAGRDLAVTSPVTAKLAGRLLDLDLADPVTDQLAGPDLDQLTVVVPVRDRATGVDRLLHSLGARVRCIVVDDASADPEALAEVARTHGAELVRLDRNRGPAAARNEGLAKVRTPYVAFIDSDVEVSAESLGTLLRHLVDPVTALVAPRILSKGGNGWLDRYENASGSLDLGPRAATIRKWSEVAYAPSACLVARVAALGAAFDATLRSGEDVDLAWRLQDDGHRIRYAAEIVVHHDTRGTFRTWIARKAFYGTSAAPLSARHGDRVAPAVLHPAAATTVAALLLQRRWSLALAGLGTAITLTTGPRLPTDLPRSTKAALLAAGGAGVVRQATGLTLRHWSPAALVLCLFSARARRAVAAMAVVDGVIAYRAADPDLDPVRFVLARRAEHLGYGVGVWWGAACARSLRCLIPHWVRS